MITSVTCRTSTTGKLEPRHPGDALEAGRPGIARAVDDESIAGKTARLDDNAPAHSYFSSGPSI